MKRRILALLALLIAALALAGSAFAFDCIRVSSSLQGLEQSTKSGNWVLFNLSSPESVQETLANLGETIPLEQATCLSTAYAASEQPVYFALGVGVAGPNGVLAHNNPNDNVLGNLKGVDHLEDSPIGAALFAAAETCGLETGG